VRLLAVSVRRRFDDFNAVVRELTLHGYASPYYLLHYLSLTPCTLAPSDASRMTHAYQRVFG